MLRCRIADINEQAEELFFRLVKQLAEKEGVTKELKRTDQTAWVGVMNNILRKRYGDTHAASFSYLRNRFFHKSVV